MTRHRHWHRQRIRRRGQALHSIDRRLHQILMQLAARGTPQDARQAIEDVFNTYGQIGQMRESFGAFREALFELLNLLRDHDREIKQEWEDLRGLLEQIRLLMRDQVRKTEDLARAVGDGSGPWDGADRRNSIPDRRRG